MSTTTDYFAPSMRQVFGEEGAPSDDPINDPNGGLTRFGISQTQHPELDVAALTQADAVAWYRSAIWEPVRCGEMPWPVCLAVFDTAVNQGNGTATRLLQASVGAVVDGDIGPRTMAAVQGAEPWDLTARLLAKRGVAYTRLGEWPMVGEGWMYRLASLALAAGRLT